MSTDNPSDDPYEAFLSAREQVMKLKWVASETVGHDVGMEAALLEWAGVQPGKNESAEGRRSASDLGSKVANP